MALHLQRLNRHFLLFCLALAGLLWAGCQHSSRDNTINPQQRFVFPGETPGAPVGGTNASSLLDTNATLIHPALLLRVGEKISMTFSDIPGTLGPHEQRIREDGTITLPFNVTIKASGKTPRQLERDIHDAYVPRLYVRMTVTVQAEERFYSVGGEVKAGGRMPYFGPTTVLRAIQAAGDFNIYGNKRKIELIRADGQRFRINWYKARDNPALDLEVLPGDQIIVHRRWW